MSYCTACGEEVQPADEFCTACGAALTGTAEAEPAAPDQAAAQGVDAVVTRSTPRTVTSEPIAHGSDVLSRAWAFLSGEPAALVVFAVAGGLQLIATVAGGVAGVLEIVAALTVAVGSGVVIFGVPRVEAGDAFDLGSLVERTIGRIVPAIVAGILWWVLVVIGLVLLVFPGIYLMLRLAFTAQAVFLEERGPVEALRSSWAQTEGNLLVVLVVLGAVVVGSIVLSLIPVVGRPLATLAVTPLGIAGLTYLYLDIQA